MLESGGNRMRQSLRYCAALTMGLALFAARPLRATDTNVAPNTIGPAMARALPAVVKLYGTGLGRAHGYGTGVLVSSDGQILTTRSLLTSARSIRAVLADGREFEAKVERDDTYRELALLKIDGTELPHLKPARSDHVQVGDTVLAVGNWFKVADGDEPPSVNRGIFAGRTTLNARRLVQPVDYAGPILVFDAMTANPGAAGGPLLDIDGNFIGLIGKIVESADTNTRPNYALPGEEISDFLGGKASPAEAATKAGYAQAFNVLEGFEGELDERGQRGRVGGWRLHALPWAQD